MPDNAQKWLQAVKAWYGRLTPRSRWLLAAGAAVAVLSAVVASAVLSQDPYRTLYTDLQPDESRAAVRKLGELKIPYRSLEDGHTLMVPASRVDAARMELAKEGIPGQDVVGFEKFDGSTLGMSSYVQRIQYVRAVQGELVRSIERLKSVRRARVHISIPPKKTFLEEEDPPKASVVLELTRGQKPSKAEVAGIAHLVASAVEGLKVSQISIVDTRGEFLHRPGDELTTDKPTALLEHQRAIEREYERRVEDILTPVVGLGKVRAKVTAELDASRTNMTEETFDPDRAAVRNTVKNEESNNGSRPNPVGIPGSRSNLPGAEVQNPPVPMANTNSEKSTQNTSFAVPRKVTVTNRPSGSIKRLTVAVVVDQPRSAEELQRLRDLVANAIGFDEGRRDSLTITSMPFTAPDLLGAPEDQAPAGWWERQPVSVRYTVIAFLSLLVLGLLFAFVRLVLRWLASGDDAEPVMPVLPRTVAELEAGQSPRPVLALSQAAALEDSEPLEKKEEEDLKRRILEKLQAHPKKGLRIVQDWIEETVSLEPVKNQG